VYIGNGRSPAILPPVVRTRRRRYNGHAESVIKEKRRISKRKNEFSVDRLFSGEGDDDNDTRVSIYIL